MTKVRTCPGCADRVAAGDAFCEGCGRTLPDEVRQAPPEPEETGDGAAPLGAADRVGEGSAALLSARGRPGGGDWTTPSGARWSRLSEYSGHVHSGGTSLTGSLAVDSEWDQIDTLATQPVRRDTSGAGGGTSPHANALPLGPRTVEGNAVGPAGPQTCAWCPGRVTDGYCGTCLHLQPTGRDHVVVRTARASGVSDVGHRHRRNEDAMAVRVVAENSEHGPGTVCAVVCDGVSSSPRSDEASRVTAETGAGVLAEQIGAGAGPREATGTAVTRAAEAVAAIADPPGSAPACTFVSAVVDPAAGSVTVGWVGDSRVYWVPDNGDADAPALLTRDDSWAEAMVQAGALTREEAMRSAHAHALIAWLGADSGEIDAHVRTVTPTGPGAVVLCSDGLWNYYDEPGEMAAAVPGPGADPLGTAREYVGLALRAGGKDNVSVVVVPVRGPRDAPVPHPSVPGPAGTLGPG
ncbi:PP2C family protein-serine/threonine phosphatase [Nocardiopsis kunsanensis]|uniref:PPM-type phosphatase domain-containing protein n=1 Tax=Nocardiopsis kunsanensis TaxID=141693 RepID=A0A918XH65_9ACTN|nr:protein phosphatase 2C domain-containing protein [Nocardiopsis kunsanensis]GHD31469.1 hypothetical protein GCM10007147_34260 [Nocardiopsis kunsanensis]